MCQLPNILKLVIGGAKPTRTWSQSRSHPLHRDLKGCTQLGLTAESPRGCPSLWQSMLRT